MRRILIALAIPVVALILAPGAHAIDHKNLDAGRPLRLEDAYPIADGEIAVEAGAGFTLNRRGPNRGVFPFELLYGALPNLQLGLGTTLLTDPHRVDEPPFSGDVGLSALYNFNQETLVLPAFGAKLSVTAPTGIDSTAWSVGVKGLVTKSFDRLSVHFNASYDFFPGGRRDERDGRYELVLGASYPVGAPKFTRATLVGDVFTEQSLERGQPNIVGTEVGLRFQLTPRVVWDVGLGTEFAGPATRSDFFMTTGLSFGF